MSDENLILQFHQGQRANGSGIWFRDVLEVFVQRHFEGVHDYIQWCFPLPEPSQKQPQTPVLSRRELEAFRASDDLKDGIRKALAVMRKFYEESPQWCTAKNHNYLRITRILRCLTLVGLHEEAKEFHAWVVEKSTKQPTMVDSMPYWDQALDAQPNWFMFSDFKLPDDQLAVLELIAINQDQGHDQVILGVLEGKGLIVPVGDSGWQMPIAAHSVWCEWCDLIASEASSPE